MSRTTWLATLLVAFVAFSGMAAAREGDPPLNEWRATQSEDGKLLLNVRYDGNGTFELNGYNPMSPGAQRGGGGFHRTGVWSTATGKFYFQQDPTDRGTDTAPHFKPLGHLIGKDRVPLQNQVAQAR